MLGTWCWISDPDTRIYVAYIPLWVCVFMVLLLNIDSIRRIRGKLLHGSSGLLHSITNNNNNGALIPNKTKWEFIRLIVICILYAVVHVPASYVRVMGAMNKVVEPKLNMIMVLAFAITLPLPGILNFFIWVVSDKQVINDWIEYLKINRILQSLRYDNKEKCELNNNNNQNKQTKGIISSYSYYCSSYYRAFRERQNNNNKLNTKQSHSTLPSLRKRLSSYHSLYLKKKVNVVNSMDMNDKDMNNNNNNYNDDDSKIEIRIGASMNDFNYNSNNNYHNNHHDHMSKSSFASHINKLSTVVTPLTVSSANLPTTSSVITTTSVITTATELATNNTVGHDNNNNYRHDHNHHHHDIESNNKIKAEISFENSLF